MNCSSCMFYRDDSACHKNPPVRLPRRFAEDATSGNRVRDEKLLWGWPEVRPTDWCGEWLPDGLQGMTQ